MRVLCLSKLRCTCRSLSGVWSASCLRLTRSTALVDHRSIGWSRIGSSCRRRVGASPSCPVLTPRCSSSPARPCSRCRLLFYSLCCSTKMRVQACGLVPCFDWYRAITHSTMAGFRMLDMCMLFTCRAVNLHTITAFISCHPTWQLRPRVSRTFQAGS